MRPARSAPTLDPVSATLATTSGYKSSRSPEPCALPIRVSGFSSDNETVAGSTDLRLARERPALSVPGHRRSRKPARRATAPRHAVRPRSSLRDHWSRCRLSPTGLPPRERTARPRSTRSANAVHSCDGLPDCTAPKYASRYLVGSDTAIAASPASELLDRFAQRNLWANGQIDDSKDATDRSDQCVNCVTPLAEVTRCESARGGARDRRNTRCPAIRIMPRIAREGAGFRVYRQARRMWSRAAIRRAPVAGDKVRPSTPATSSHRCATGIPTNSTRWT